MSKVHEGWTKAHAHTPLTHTAADNKGLPPAVDQGEGASRTDRHGPEKKFEKSERLDEKDEGKQVNASSDIHVKPNATQGDREWVKGTSRPKEQK